MKTCIRSTLWLLATLLAPALAQAQSNYASPTTFTTFAGQAGTPGVLDGTGSAARFSYPYGVAIDSAGNIYVGDTYNYTVRKITPAGVVTTITGVPGGSGGTDTADGAAPRYNGPEGLTIDGAGNVFIADTLGAKIREYSAAGIVTTIAGSGAGGFADGTGRAAIFNNPTSLVLDGAGNLFVTDMSNDVIRKITPGGIVTTFAGIPGSFGSEDGAQGVARFNQPSGIAIDGAGNLYIADKANNTIRKITSAGFTTTIAGSPAFRDSGSRDGIGGAARFFQPAGIAIDGAGNLYVADTFNSTIRKITPAGLVTTLAGTVGTTGTSANGTGGAVQFYWPNGIAVDTGGNLYVADTFNCTIRKGTTTGVNDIDANGKPDITWQNTTTGDLGFWLMNGTTFSSWVDVGVMPTEWRIAATADFNADGKTDLLWENTTTGDRYFWFMNGTTVSGAVFLGNLATSWHIAAAADFDGTASRTSFGKTLSPVIVVSG